MTGIADIDKVDNPDTIIVMDKGDNKTIKICRYSNKRDWWW